MSSDKPALLCEHDGPIAVITNNDAPMNRMTLGFIDELEVLIQQLAKNVSVRAIVIRGAGEENFSVGMNLKQLGAGIEPVRFADPAAPAHPEASLGSV